MTNKLLVLMVEDSEDDALMTVRELERGGLVVEWTRVDTEETMKAALWEKQHWDVILCDYHMPKFSAGRALELVQKSGLDIPFIIISGIIGETVAVEAMREGAHDYLMKGKLGRLGAAIEREMREVRVRKERVYIEGRLRETLDSLMEGCQIYGFDWKCIYANDSATVQVHKAKPDMLDHTLTETYPGIDGTALHTTINLCMKERKPQRVMGELALADGSKGNFHISMLPVPEGMMILSTNVDYCGDGNIVKI
jgi:CheY-like chemotaxis protein